MSWVAGHRVPRIGQPAAGARPCAQLPCPLKGACPGPGPRLAAPAQRARPQNAGQADEDRGGARTRAARGRNGTVDRLFVCGKGGRGRCAMTQQ
jgi:hypothetical protein